MFYSLVDYTLGCNDLMHIFCVDSFCEIVVFFLSILHVLLRLRYGPERHSMPCHENVASNDYLGPTHKLNCSFSKEMEFHISKKYKFQISSPANNKAKCY